VTQVRKNWWGVYQVQVGGVNRCRLMRLLGVLQMLLR
jgi:hypothetical protein